MNYINKIYVTATDKRMCLKGIKLITFDATNTLLKFRLPPWQHYAKVAQDYGYQGNIDDLKTQMLSSYKNTWNEYPNFGRNTIMWEEWWRKVVTLTFNNQLPANTDVKIIANRLIEEYKTTKCWTLAKGSKELLKFIKNHGILLGVVSNFDPRLHDILSNVNISDKFNFILTSYDVGHTKPDKEIFEAALKCCDTQVLSSESIHIGDDLKEDYKGAIAAGWHALIIDENQRIEKPPAKNCVFKNLEELTLSLEQNKFKLDTLS